MPATYLVEALRSAVLLFVDLEDTVLWVLGDDVVCRLSFVDHTETYFSFLLPDGKGTRFSAVCKDGFLDRFAGYPVVQPSRRHLARQKSEGRWFEKKKKKIKVDQSRKT